MRLSEGKKKMVLDQKIWLHSQSEFGFRSEPRSESQNMKPKVAAAMGRSDTSTIIYLTRIKLSLTTFHEGVIKHFFFNLINIFINLLKK